MASGLQMKEQRHKSGATVKGRKRELLCSLTLWIARQEVVEVNKLVLYWRRTYFGFCKGKKALWIFWFFPTRRTMRDSVCQLLDLPKGGPRNITTSTMRRSSVYWSQL